MIFSNNMGGVCFDYWWKRVIGLSFVKMSYHKLLSFLLEIMLFCITNSL